MRRTFHVLLFATLFGCVGTAVPQPPNLDPVDPDLIVGMIPEMAGAPLDLVGQAGAAAAGAELWIWDLGAATPPAVFPIEADGSFSISLPAPRGPLRMQARDGDSRSPPLDVVASPGGTLELARPACLLVGRELFLTEARTAELPIVNDCDSDAILGATRMRAGEAFTIERPAELTLPPSSQAELRLAAPGDAAAEEILLIELELDRTTYLFAVTLSAPAR